MGRKLDKKESELYLKLRAAFPEEKTDCKRCAGECKHPRYVIDFHNPNGVKEWRLCANCLIWNIFLFGPGVQNIRKIIKEGENQ